MPASAPAASVATPFTSAVVEVPPFGAAITDLLLPVAIAMAVNGTAFATFVRSVLRDSFSMSSVPPPNRYVDTHTHIDFLKPAINITRRVAGAAASTVFRSYMDRADFRGETWNRLLRMDA